MILRERAGRCVGQETICSANHSISVPDGLRFPSLVRWHAGWAGHKTWCVARFLVNQDVVTFQPPPSAPISAALACRRCVRSVCNAS